jgi:hypothetical protein
MYATMKLPEDIREYFRKQGKIGAAKRTAKLSPERRAEIAKKAAETRWAKTEKKSAITKRKNIRGGK